MKRRDFLVATGVSAAALAGTRVVPAAQTARPALLKPRRLQAGDVVGVVAPATATYQQVELDIVRESLEALGLKVHVGPHVMNRYGSLAGADKDRAADINGFFADREVRAVLPTRGGWGSARLLPHLDFDSIRGNPKVILGYSDITALLNSIHARTGLVTFHGPNGGGRWDAYSLDWMKRVLFGAEAITYANPKTTNDKNVLTQIDNRIRMITPGKARGRLLGGNLSVLTGILGSPFVPDFTDAILFLEDVEEQPYRVDRMMTSLKLAGILGRVRGVIFGTCSECTPSAGYASFTLEEILNDHLKPLNVPA
jgi:muramoyltetrapeptide carboxypeptidase